MLQVALVPVSVWVAALAFWGLSLWRAPRPLLRWFVIDRALRYIFIFPLGLLSLWAFLGHVFFPAEAAAEIGWQPSPFQFEVGYANLGIGLASLYAAFTTFYARVAVAIAASCFLVGSGIGHVHDIIAYGNLTPGNAGPILIADFLTPVMVLLLLIASARRTRRLATAVDSDAAQNAIGAEPAPEKYAANSRSADSRALDAEIEAARDAMRSYREALDRFVKS
ncbi:MAG: DUF6790 family protein [Pseudomonadota bacterium]